MEKLLYTKREAAALLSISPRKLDDLIAHDQLRVRRVGRRTLIHAVELERFARGEGEPVPSATV